MADYTANLAAVLAAVTALGAKFDAVAKPRQVLVTDVNNREVLVTPDFVFHMVELKWKLPLIPNSYIPATLCLLSALSDGRLVNCYLPGKPAAVAAQLGIDMKKVLLSAPAVITEAATPADAQSAIDAMTPVEESVSLAGKTPSDASNPTVVPVTATAGAPKILVIKDWNWIMNGERSFWEAKKNPDGSVDIVEAHGSGFTVRAFGYLGFKMDGDTGFVTMSSIEA